MSQSGRMATVTISSARQAADGKPRCSRQPPWLHGSGRAAVDGLAQDCGSGLDNEQQLRTDGEKLAGWGDWKAPS